VPDLNAPADNLTYAITVKTQKASGDPDYAYIRSRRAANITPPNMSEVVCAALPKMEFSVEKKHGGVKDETAQLVVPIDTEPFATIRKEERAVTDVSVYEVDFDNLSTGVTHVYTGTVAEIEAYKDGGADVLTVKLFGRKFWLKNVSLGILTDDLCIWSFGGDQCTIALSSIDTEQEITALSYDEVTFTTLPNSGTTNYYKNGFIEYEGLQLRIRKHDGLNVYLDRPAPAHWLNETVRVVPGCLKDIASCRDRWNNEEHFGGFGKRMPEYDPRFQG
jgi:hypothetical protein